MTWAVSGTDMSSRTIAMHHVRAALGGARRRGVAVEPLLLAAGISPLLLADDRARVLPEQFTRLIQELWDALDDEYMGFGNVPSKRGTFAMMCWAVIHCPDLGAALTRAAAFYGLFPSGPRFRLVHAAGEVRVELDMRETDDPDRFLTESLLVIWHRFANWLIGRRIPLSRVEFGYPAPAHVAEYDPMFGCPLVFDREVTALAFDERFLAAPLVQDEATLRVFLKNSPADLLSRREYGATVAARARRILTQGLGGSVPDLEAVAARLAMSPQTLRRRLREEGTSFRRIKDEIRRDAAIAGLVRGGESVEELAARLGFSEPSAFHRAFKRWTGTTPGAYRAGR
ncbi:Transcriptional regulator [Carbonactinospora thermoautotrophica]|uniref:Transcriptional regulator n=2 Tax=Carbonactinospora thermoautotrophica TaxID=1469144 RepID=A0A132MVP7_9ACTN|nr:Transcriptional regulator [Carbonactinospora thermoautotrophica]